MTEMSNIAKLRAGIFSLVITVGLTGLIPLPAASAPDVSGTDSMKLQRAVSLNDYRPKMARLRMPFIANEGQIGAKQVRYYAKTFGGTLFVTERGEMVYALPYRGSDKKKSGDRILREYLTGAAAIKLQALDPSPTRVSYFIGDRTRWRSNIATYNELSLGEVYAGIHLKLRAYGKNVEKIFTVDPGTTPEAIRVQLEGASNLEVNAAGELVAHTDLGPVTFSKPVAFQEIAGKRRSVAVAYHTNKNSYGFSVGQYDPRIPLVIDPLLAATFLGAELLEEAYDVVLDGSGYVYVTGWTSSLEFPVTGSNPTDPDSGSTDAFVSKLDSGLDNLVASTYLGGTSDSKAYGIGLGPSNSVYVTGKTKATDFPTFGDVYDDDKAEGSWDVFVTRLSTSSLGLVASTYLDTGQNDTTGEDVGKAVVHDSTNGFVFVCGYTASSDFPGVAGGGGELRLYLCHEGRICSPAGRGSVQLSRSGIDVSGR